MAARGRGTFSACAATKIMRVAAARQPCIACQPARQLAAWCPSCLAVARIVIRTSDAWLMPGCASCRRANEHCFEYLPH